MIRPRGWKRSTDADSSRPSSDANRQPKPSCSRRHRIHSGEARAAARGAGGGKARSAAARSAAAATWGAALPSPPPDTAPTAAPPPPPLPAVAVSVVTVSVPTVVFAATNQNRWIVPCLIKNGYDTNTRTFSLYNGNGEGRVSWLVSFVFRERKCRLWKWEGRERERERERERGAARV